MATRFGNRVVLSSGFAFALADAQLTDPGDAMLNGLEIHLMGAAGFNPSAATTLAELEAVEAGYSGYGAVLATNIGAVGLGATAVGAAFDALMVPSATDPFVPDTITGWWGISTFGPDWSIAGKFDVGDSVPIGSALDWLLLTVALPFYYAQAVPVS